MKGTFLFHQKHCEKFSSWTKRSEPFLCSDKHCEKKRYIGKCKDTLCSTRKHSLEKGSIGEKVGKKIFEKRCLFCILQSITCINLERRGADEKSREYYFLPNRTLWPRNCAMKKWSYSLVRFIPDIGYVKNKIYYGGQKNDKIM